MPKIDKQTDHVAQTNKKSGVLLPVTALFGGQGIGGFGKAAYHFIDSLAEANQTVWQILPLNPVTQVAWNSPYSSESPHAIDTKYIDLENLLELGLISSIGEENFKNSSFVDYVDVEKNKEPYFDQAFEAFKKMPDTNSLKAKYQQFLSEEKYWLEEHVRFVAISENLFPNKAWNKWLDPYRNSLEILGSNSAKLLEQIEPAIEKERFLQFIAEYQWLGIKNYANSKGIEIMGDIPIYVSDGASTWGNPLTFQMDDQFNKTFVAGVGPDSFNPEDGQRWGNPLYDWDKSFDLVMDFWITRIKRVLTLYDRVKIDHFRGFDNYCKIPAADDTARNFVEVNGPGMKFVKALKEAGIDLKKFIAEDLGVISESVSNLRDNGFKIPGMAVTQMAFMPRNSELEKTYFPDMLKEHVVAYTGTHDNLPITTEYTHRIKGPYATSYQKLLNKYFDCEITSANITKKMATATLRSNTELCIIPAFDILNLDETNQIEVFPWNIPGALDTTFAGGIPWNGPKNAWTWRLSDQQIWNKAIKQFGDIARRTGR